MIASTMRLSTRAVSAIVSPRPSWVVADSSTSDVPPSWRIAMSKLTRVRVEFFSKIIPSTWPASGWSASGFPFGQPARAALRSIASASIAATASPPASSRLRKWRIAMLRLRRSVIGRAGRELLEEFVDLGVADHQRRQDPQGLVAGGHGQQLVVVAQVLHERPRFGFHPDAEHQAPAAHLLEQLGVVADELLEPGADAFALLAHRGEERVIGDGIQHCHAGRDPQRIAAISRAVGAERHAAGGLFRRQARTEWEAAADALGDRHDVGRE